MKYATFNKEKYSALEEPMFFGRSVNVARFDQQKYPVFEKRTEQQLTQFWLPDEFPLSKDCVDFDRLSARERHIFIENLLYQTLLDSIQGRSPTMAFLPIVSLPELETWIETWAFFETIHSRSYTYILRNLPADAGAVFDSLVDNQAVLARAESVTRYYDEFIEYASWYNLLGFGKHTVNGEVIHVDRDTLYMRLYLALLSVLALEGIRFYVSFACSFSFAERGLMEGVGKIIQAIAKDEKLHHSVVAEIVRKLKNGRDSGLEPFKTVAERCQYQVCQMFDDVVAQETAWAEHLFGGETVRGLNASLLTQYLHFMADGCLKSIGMQPRYGSAGNPLPWMQKWLGSDMQVAPQETKRADYIVGRFYSGLTDGDYQSLRAIYGGDHV